MLLATILATAIAPLPSCDSELVRFEKMFVEWSAGERTVTRHRETHRYHTVTAKGQTIRFTLVALSRNDAYDMERAGFQGAAECMFDGREGAIVFQREIR